VYFPHENECWRCRCCQAVALPSGNFSHIVGTYPVTHVSPRRVVLHTQGSEGKGLTLDTFVAAVPLIVTFHFGSQSPHFSAMTSVFNVGETDPHFKNPPEIVDHPGTSDILFSTYYALGHTYFNLAYCLGRIVWTWRRRGELPRKTHIQDRATQSLGLPPPGAALASSPHVL